MAKKKTNETRAFMIVAAETVQDNIKRMNWIQNRFRKGIKYKMVMEEQIDENTTNVRKVPTQRISSKEKKAIARLRSSNNWLFQFANTLRMELKDTRIEIYEGNK